MEFAVWIFRHAVDHQLKAMGPTMLQASGGDEWQTVEWEVVG